MGKRRGLINWALVFCHCKRNFHFGTPFLWLIVGVSGCLRVSFDWSYLGDLIWWFFGFLKLVGCWVRGLWSCYISFGFLRLILRILRVPDLQILLIWLDILQSEHLRGSFWFFRTFFSILYDFGFLQYSYAFEYYIDSTLIFYRFSTKKFIFGISLQIFIVRK